MRNREDAERGNVVAMPAALLAETARRREAREREEAARRPVDAEAWYHAAAVAAERPAAR